MPNRLAEESSPYLLQHAENPVDWHPWGQQAIERARNEDKPIFLSIGYSACHWCHVMEHESFENQFLADKLNRAFVCIKVDREERPDLDQIYMNAVQLMTGHGGWPMSVFLTPELQPFYGGTYWPPVARQGMPGFGDVLEGVIDAWNNRRDQALEQAGRLTEHLQQIGRHERPEHELDVNRLFAAAGKLERHFDFTNGGFGSAPKFPHPMDLSLLLRVWQRTGRDGVLDRVRLTLDKMARGGIYDHLGGGFARYSVDERWLVPHFEKMLYDNALLAGTYLEGFLATGNREYAQTVRQTCDYVLRYMTDDQGGFHSTEDADSEGEEGKFYVWTLDQITQVLGPERGERFCHVYDVTEAGNFEGNSILNLPKSIEQHAAMLGLDGAALAAELDESRKELLAVRDQRIRPAKDDKILVSWNALMIDSMSRAAGALREPAYLTAAQNAAHFLLSELKRSDGRLFHSWRHGRAHHAAYLDDYADLVQALHSLYEASFDERWIDEAVQLADILLAHFYDSSEGGFYFTADDHEKLIARNKDVHDSSVPSGNGMAASALWRLGKLCGRNDFLDASARTVSFAQGIMEESPTAAGQLWLAADWQMGPVREIVLYGEPAEIAELGTTFRSHYLPRDVISARPMTQPNGSRHLAALHAGKSAEAGVPTAYVCQDFTCQTPVVGAEQIAALWSELAQL
jgi:uncharacterized protein YyaL (SSP411 family)